MLPEGTEKPVPLTQRVIAEFDLTSASDAWPIAADWFEDHGGDSVSAEAMRQGLWRIDIGTCNYSDGYGDGDGDGYCGRNGGEDYGDGDGYGYGCSGGI